MDPGERESIDRFLVHLALERRMSRHTVAAYRRDLERLAAFCDGRHYDRWDALQSMHVRAFAASEHSGGMSPRSVQRRLSAARSFFSYLQRENEAPQNPAVEVRAPKGRKRLPATLDADQIGRLLDFKADDALSVRDKAIMELFYSSGLRLGELVGLDLTAIDLRDATVRVTGKGNKTRIVPIGRQARAALSAWLEHRPRWARHTETGGRAAAFGPVGAVARCGLGAPPRPQRTRPPPHVPALLCHASARVERRPPRSAGIAGSRRCGNDANLHACRFPSSGARVRGRPPAGPAPSRLKRRESGPKVTSA